MQKKGKSGQPITPPISAPAGTFPREMTVSNDTARPHVIGRKFVAPAGTALVLVASADEFVRIQTDINQLLELSVFHSPAVADPSRPPAIRLTDETPAAVVPVVPVVPVVTPPVTPVAPDAATPPAK